MALGTIVSIKNCKPSGLRLKKLFLMICTAMKLVSLNSIFAMAKLYAPASAPASFDLCLSSCPFQLLCVDLKSCFASEKLLLVNMFPFKW